MSETLAEPVRTDRSPVTKALQLLEQVARRQEPVGLAELARTIGLPKPTAYRLLRSLERSGFVQRDPLTPRYLIGSLLEDLALSALRHGAGHSGRRLLMDGLAQRLGARINLVVLRAGNVLSVEWVESTAPLRVDIGPATTLPVHCTASGKLLLAFGPEELRESVLRSAPFPACTRNSITGARALARELAAIRSRGWAEDDEELLAGVNCLAVPIRNRLGDVVAGLAAMAPVASAPLTELRRHLADLRRVAGRISQELGGARAREAEAGTTAIADDPRAPAARRIARRAGEARQASRLRPARERLKR